MTIGARHFMPMTRRGFLTTAGIGVAAAGLAPAISTPFISRAYAQTKTLTIVQWSHFVPAFDTWFDKFAHEWGNKERYQRNGRPHPRTKHRRARGLRGRGAVRARPVHVERCRRPASLSQVSDRHDQPGRLCRKEIRQGQHHRPADRLQSRTTRPGRPTPTTTSTTPACTARSCGTRSA